MLEVICSNIVLIVSEEINEVSRDEDIDDNLTPYFDNIYFFGSDRSSRCHNVCPSVRADLESRPNQPGCCNSSTVEFKLFKFHNGQNHPPQQQNYVMSQSGY